MTRTATFHRMRRFDLAQRVRIEISRLSQALEKSAIHLPPGALEQLLEGLLLLFDWLPLDRLPHLFRLRTGHEDYLGERAVARTTKDRAAVSDVVNSRQFVVAGLSLDCSDKNSVNHFSADEAYLKRRRGFATPGNPNEY